MNNANKITFDDGAQTLNINGHDLRWYPNDLEFVDRFMRFAQYADTDLKRRIEEAGTGMQDAENYQIGTMGKLGDEFKKELDKAFNSDVSRVFQGVNPLSPTPNGGLVYENFMDAIMPYMENSFQTFSASREKYTAGSRNRAARRALAQK